MLYMHCRAARWALAGSQVAVQGRAYVEKARHPSWAAGEGRVAACKHLPAGVCCAYMARSTALDARNTAHLTCVQHRFPKALSINLNGAKTLGSLLGMEGAGGAHGA